MQKDSGITLTALKVDGGACANDFLMQFQADVTQVPVQRPVCIETTALGAAYLAGLAVGYWADKKEIISNWAISKVFEPTITVECRDKLIAGWRKAVGRSLKWIDA